MHGDYWAGNVLVTTTDGRPRVSGIIDWENSRHDGIAAVDQAHLWLVERHEEIGAALVDQSGEEIFAFAPTDEFDVSGGYVIIDDFEAPRVQIPAG